MDCAKSLEMLSDYREGSLDGEMREGVRTHLIGCPPCLGVLNELDLIVNAAAILRDAEDGVFFPDEIVLWQRMGLEKRAVH